MPARRGAMSGPARRVATPLASWNFGNSDPVWQAGWEGSDLVIVRHGPLLSIALWAIYGAGNLAPAAGISVAVMPADFPLVQNPYFATGPSWDNGGTFDPNAIGWVGFNGTTLNLDFHAPAAVNNPNFYIQGMVQLQ